MLLNSSAHNPMMGTADNARCHGLAGVPGMERDDMIRIHLLATGEVIEVEARDWMEALRKVDRRDAAVVSAYPWPGRPDAIAAILLADDHPRPQPMMYIGDTADDCLKAARDHLQAMTESEQAGKQ